MQEFFQAVTVSVLLFGCTPWTLAKYSEKILERKYKDAAWCFEQVLEAVLYNVAAL